MAETLEQVIADARGELPLLRKRGQAALADALSEYMDRVAGAAEDYLKFISEEDARLQSGRSVSWLRSRFNEWMELGHAEYRNKRRYYRAIMIPHRPDIAAAREAGRRGSRVA